jgi:3-hydroxybutyrate dehydrogenase
MSTFASDCLSGKSILITGGLGSIGRAVVGALLAHGACVIANDILDPEKEQAIASEQKWSPSRYAYIQADVTKPKEATGLVHSTLSKTGKIDIALCHAGMVHSCPILDYPTAEWDKIIELKLPPNSWWTSTSAAKSSLRLLGFRIFHGQTLFLTL